MNFCIVGLGLIGGSVGLDLKGKPGIIRVGVDLHPENAQEALSLGLVDRIEEEGKALTEADVVLLTIPVNAIKALLPQILDVVKPDATVIDLGSTKSVIGREVAAHPRRHQYVAAHPVAGTENSGPRAAVRGLFNGKVNIICDRELSGEHHRALAENIFSMLGLKTIFMGADEHDKHVAYVSHLSHVSSFLLGQTVLDMEKDEKQIFNLAGSGFASTVRLAKSSPDMWTPIVEQNAEYLGQALAEYIMHLQRFQYHLMKRNTREIHAVLREANQIRRVLDRQEQEPKAEIVVK
ncbi:MAG: prephenate dehydrogenase [Cyclobacteriaceae bacterium]|nr:prephenate dehydrogenase [Cyclobacteriaceae bacterium]